ncbi:MAG: tetratricopeptide repeat protein [bacterium]|nr:tetratricopeptide repeat protein [bacterium]
MNIKQIAIYSGSVILLGAITICGWLGFQVYQQHQQSLAEIKTGDAFYRSMNYELALQAYKHAKEILPKADVDERIRQSEEALVAVMEQELQQIKTDLTTPDTAKDVQVPFDFENVPSIENEFINYYYRRPLPTQIVPMLERYLSDEVISDDSAVGKIVSHFWGMLLHQTPGKLEQVKLLQPKFSEQALDLLQKIIDTAEHFQPVLITSPEHLHLAWAEFIASGKVSYIDKIFDVFKLEKTPENMPLLTLATQYVLEKSPRYGEVSERVLREADHTTDIQQERLEQLSQQLRSRILNPARHYSTRGRNYSRQKQYQKALQEYKNSVNTYPAYSGAYGGIALIYKQMGERGRALRFLKRALWMDPYDQRAYFNLGSVYAKMLDYESAIVMYKKAVDINPDYPLFLYGLASAYKKNHDTANAITYFQEYLKYAPENKKVESVKEYLASLDVKQPKRPESVISLLRQREYLRLDQHMKKLLKQKKRDDGGFRFLYTAYNEFTADDRSYDDLETRLRYFNEWVQQQPSSHFANAVIGKFYLFYGQKARGIGTAGTITEQGRKLFKERLQLAKTYLEKAYSLEPKDPFVPAALISVALNIGLGLEEMERQFQRAIQADPDAYYAYWAKLIYLQPQWRGSEQEMFAFARKAARNSSSKSRIPLLLTDAHWNMQRLSKHPYAYFKVPDVWKETRMAYETFLSHYPHAMGTHNRFALAAYLAGDYSTAKQEFEKIGNNWYTSVWRDYRYFSRIKQEVTNQ